MGWRCHEQDLPLLFPFLYVSSPCAINHLTLVFYLATPLLKQTNPFYLVQNSLLSQGRDREQVFLCLIQVFNYSCIEINYLCLFIKPTLQDSALIVHIFGPSSRSPAKQTLCVCDLSGSLFRPNTCASFFSAYLRISVVIRRISSSSVFLFSYLCSFSGI